MSIAMKNLLAKAVEDERNQRFIFLVRFPRSVGLCIVSQSTADWRVLLVFLALVGGKHVASASWSACRFV